MTETPDGRRESHLADLRDELGEQFLRVARDEPRSRVRRRLRYAGITLVCGLLVVPAAVAISGGSSEGPGLDPEIGSFAACAELPGARAGVPPRALRLGAAAPRRLEALPYPRELELPSMAELRARDRDLRSSRLGFDGEALREDACAIPAPAPALARLRARAADECVAIAAPRIERREPLDVARCLDDTVRLGVPGGRPLRPADPPAALRSDCLEIRALGGKLRGLEARPCRDALAVPAEPPRSRLAPRR